MGGCSVRPGRRRRRTDEQATLAVGDDGGDGRHDAVRWWGVRVVQVVDAAHAVSDADWSAVLAVAHTRSNDER